MSSSFSEKPRIHPSFPLPEETAARPEWAYSDHLPILVRVPLPNGHKLNVISLNVLGDVRASGVHPPGADETDEQIKERYQRIAAGLRKASDMHFVDVLALQEAGTAPRDSIEPYIVPILREALGDEWEVRPAIHNRRALGLVTCFRKSAWNLRGYGLVFADRIQTLILDRAKSKESVSVSNIWGNFEHCPVSLERQCERTLAIDNTTPTTVAMIIGDTNSRIAPLDLRRRNITTGAIPLGFNKANGVPDGAQIPDHPDGGFYRAENGAIYQLETQTLSFNSGEILEDTRVLEEVSPWLEQRMVMCLDSSYKTKKMFGEKTLFEYEAYLQEKFDNKQIIVRESADCFNQKGIGIRFPRKFAQEREFIQNQLGSDTDFSVRSLDEKSGVVLDYLFVPMDKIDLLQQAIEKCTTDKNAHKSNPVNPVAALNPFRNWKQNAALGLLTCFVFIMLFTLIGFATSGVFPFAFAPLVVGFLGTATGTGMLGGLGIFMALAAAASTLAGGFSALIGGLINKLSVNVNAAPQSIHASAESPTPPAGSSSSQSSHQAQPEHYAGLFENPNRGGAKDEPEPPPALEPKR